MSGVAKFPGDERARQRRERLTRRAGRIGAAAAGFKLSPYGSHRAASSIHRMLSRTTRVSRHQVCTEIGIPNPGQSGKALESCIEQRPLKREEDFASARGGAGIRDRHREFGRYVDIARAIARQTRESGDQLVCELFDDLPALDRERLERDMRESPATTPGLTDQVGPEAEDLLMLLKALEDRLPLRLLDQYLRACDEQFLAYEDHRFYRSEEYVGEFDYLPTVVPQARLYAALHAEARAQVIELGADEIPEKTEWPALFADDESLAIVPMDFAELVSLVVAPRASGNGAGLHFMYQPFTYISGGRIPGWQYSWIEEFEASDQQTGLYRVTEVLPGNSTIDLDDEDLEYESTYARFEEVSLSSCQAIFARNIASYSHQFLSPCFPEEHESVIGGLETLGGLLQTMFFHADRSLRPQNRLIEDMKTKLGDFEVYWAENRQAVAERRDQAIRDLDEDARIDWSALTGPRKTDGD